MGARAPPQFKNWSIVSLINVISQTPQWPHCCSPHYCIGIDTRNPSWEHYLHGNLSSEFTGEKGWTVKIYPKQGSTYSRNASFRDHSAIHLVNNGPGESIFMKMAALGVHPSPPSISTLWQLQHRRDCHWHRKTSRTARARKAILQISHKYTVLTSLMPLTLSNVTASLSAISYIPLLCWQVTKINTKTVATSMWYIKVPVLCQQQFPNTKTFD